ncbi:MAG: hypothetical protein FJW37_04250 [Acidobacteria bacterium]|nr:hypothetical protein [Acidobacteriota bacterium]
MVCPIEEHGGAQVLLDYCARRLAPAAGAALEHHLQECARCRAFFRRQSAVWEALETWEVPPAAGEFDRRLYERVAAEGRRSWWARLAGPAGRDRGVLRPAFALASVTLILAGAFLLEGPRHLAGGNPSYQAQTEVAEQVERALEDLEMLRELDRVASESM